MAIGWAPDYASTSELASLVRIGDVLDDAQLGLAIATASRAIDHATGRQFGRLAAPEPRVYTARWSAGRGRWAVEVNDLMTLGGLAVDVDTDGTGIYGAAADVAFLQARPPNAGAAGKPWTGLAFRPGSPVQPSGCEDGVQVTARWGWSSVPTAIRQATLMQASRLLARRDAPFGVAGSPEAGSEVRLLARLDPDVAVAVAPYRRWWGVI